MYKSPAGGSGPGRFPHHRSAAKLYDLPMADRRKWEYKVWAAGLRASLNDDRLQTKLTEMGNEGWELVTCKGEQYIFKRPT